MPRVHCELKSHTDILPHDPLSST